MQRVRRLAALVLVAVLGAGVLAGCRSDPSVAAYVGDKQYSQRHIEAMVREVVDAVNQVSPDSRGSIDFAAVRQLVLSSVVVRDVAGRVAAERHVTVPKADPEVAAQMLGLQAGSPLTPLIEKTGFAELIAGTAVALQALAGTVAPVEPSEAEQREVYDNLSYDGELPAFDQVRQYLNREALGQELGLRGVLADGVQRFHVEVNPRYAPLAYQIPIQLGQVSGYVSVPILSR